MTTKASSLSRLKPYHDTRFNAAYHRRAAQHPYKIFPGVQTYVKPLPMIDLQVSTTDINSPYQYTLQSLDPPLLYQSTETFY